MGWIVGQVAVTHPFVEYQYVGLNVVGAGYSAPVTSLPLPAGAKTGDIMLVTASGVGFQDCSDPRVRPLGSVAGLGAAWIGYLTTDHSPLAVTVQGTNGAITQFAHAAVALYRGVELDGVVRQPLFYDLTRTAMGPINGGLPSLGPKKGSGAIAVAVARGGIGGAYGTMDWSVGGVYVGLGEAGNTYCISNYARTDLPTVPSAPNPDQDTGDSCVCWSVGLR